MAFVIPHWTDALANDWRSAAVSVGPERCASNLLWNRMMRIDLAASGLSGSRRAWRLVAGRMLSWQCLGSSLWLVTRSVELLYPSVTRYSEKISSQTHSRPFIIYYTEAAIENKTALGLELRMIPNKASNIQ